MNFEFIYPNEIVFIIKFRISIF